MSVKFYIDDSEKAQMNPLMIQQVIKDRSNNQESYLITRGFFPDQHQHAENQGLSSDYLINMYDYFQHATNVSDKEVKYRYTNVVDKTRLLLGGEDWGLASAHKGGITFGRITEEFEIYAPG
ncbi:MAG: glycosyl transferase, partial [Lactobacillaceae bacterium]|nr:glycosyl transferase [Lactobacillaceae bacterium]